MNSQPTNLRDELRNAAQQSRERPDWTKRRMPTITGRLTTSNQRASERSERPAR